ncbi:MAG: AAA family ATPase [Leuconostoc pseudomesenteroides]|uniref:Nucleotide-binding protein n=1 Tax=Leuconostoc falkenbergense TaxID=2766470 RepID=A0A9X3INL4_9LACO|nr:AAA family ATPase [Leuconostoc falkenbergense]MCX7578183.1 nucleotide-binding protein [Leuconostoc falkenbergense]MDI6667085.1 AAA family ATPase [Leuconostoc falkenbergense]
MKAYRAGEIPKVGNMYFVYGDGGTGKTSLVKQFPGKKLLLIFDGSTNALVGTNDIDVMAFEDTDAPQMQQLVTNMLERSFASHDVIILDNVTALQNWALENIDGASKDGRQNYQKLQVWFRNLGMWLRGTDKTVLATAHQVDNGSSGLTGEGRFQADMNEKTFNAFTAPFDLVGRIYKEGDERWIDLDPQNGNHTKNRIDDRKLIKASELIAEEK